MGHCKMSSFNLNDIDCILVFDPIRLLNNHMISTRCGSNFLEPKILDFYGETVEQNKQVRSEEVDGDRESLNNLRAKYDLNGDWDPKYYVQSLNSLKEDPLDEIIKKWNKIIKDIENYNGRASASYIVCKQKLEGQ